MKILSIGLLCLFLGFLKFHDYKIAINKTPSLPYTLFISKPFDVIEKNSIVAFSMPQCNVKFCKIVAGLPGDELIIDQEYLSINGTRITTLPSQTKLEYTTSGIIPEGHFFALGTAENSFDSRYSTFGLVPFTSIESVLWPLF